MVLCLLLRLLVFFFFSSRRRHTRLQGDWSSDVCSSDLREQLARAFLGHRLMRLAAAEAPGGARQPGERPGDAEGDEPGAGERQGEQPQSPAEPLQAERRREAL